MAKFQFNSARQFAHSASRFALGTALVAAFAAPAFAQDAAPAEDEEDAIVVSGFRASLENAVNEKKNNDQIVESVSAEDIGKLPDASIGESIARLPGVTSQRLNGRSNNISIRGFGPDFSQTLLNGREQTSTGDNRAVEFDQYPSEIVSQVVVFKSPTASLVGQGLVGTIDIRTVRPLDYGKSVLAVGARGTYADLGALNAGSKKYGYRANATFIDQFADDTIGIALSASYVDEPYQLQEFNAWGYAGAGTAASPAVIGGSKSYVTSTQLKRLGLNGTLQYQASDTVRMTLDGFYSNFEDDQSKRGIELPLGFGAFGTTFNPATATVNNGFVTAGTFNNVQGVVRNDIFQRKANLYSFGYNVEYEGGDGWKAFIDLGYSKTDRNELSIESYSGTGFGEPLGATDTISFVSGPSGTSFDPTLDYSNPALIRLTDPLGWGGGVVPQAGYYNNRIVEDELKQYRVGVEKEVEGFFSAIKFGMNYTDRGKSLTPDEFLVRLRGGALELAIPTNALLRPTNLSYLGLGPIVSYDARDLIADGTLVLDRNLSPDIPAKAFRVTEDLMTAYLQADIEQEMGSGTLTGNIGVQAIHTDQESSGTVFAGGVARSVRSGANYWDILPSLNLSMRFDSDFVIRFAASRQIQRPRLDDLRVAVSYGINNNAADSPTGLAPFIDGSGGNPQLRPYRANAFDLNFEKYFGQSGVISLQLFHKDVKSYIDRTRFPFDFAGYPLPTGLPPATLIGRLESSFNTGGGKLYGGELAVTLPFSNFSSALDGFGITGGVGYTKTKVKDAQGNVDQIPGYSKWVANGTAYFEKWGFNARGSVRYRSTFLGDFTGFGGSPTRRTALAEMIVDGQIGYDFQEGSALQGLSLYLQGQNLTDERFASVGASRNQVIDYQIYGRRFLAGFTYKF
ncbi:MAG TPA: TonB-dependent receptor [Sphingorhabdus lacus]|jgi:iron complex outermembrane receptor protein|uniref:TonB-dependent receptor n=1 Tax=Sphingorhabdus lacus TaxID=392610 RepID=UPI002B901AD5|nr:TonB-dependent receptor [Sphingorhabdus lacus]HPV66952.1 TonB-dependent receptor [Sphingorhabdus lacus]